ncbi:MAG: LytR/AlgR family response regulator transcription factor [Flavisolibacter sp.]
MKAIIIDDEPLARGLVKELLNDYPQVQVIEECNNGFEGVKAIQQHHPDVIFLDIQMPKITGFEMLELVEEPPAVIFTTAFDEYALQAFEKHAVDYLLKPFSKERFAKAMDRLLNTNTRQQQQASTEALLNETGEASLQQERIVVKTGGNIRIIPFSQVRYLEAADDYVKVHTADGSFLKNRRMSYYEAHLPASRFVRVHRSYIVNVQEITRVEPYQKDNFLVLLKSGGSIPVSRSGYTRLRTVLGI